MRRRRTPSRGPKRNRRDLVEAIEPRLLLSADLPLEAVLPPAHEPARAGTVEILRERTGDSVEQYLPRREIVFVDAGVEGWQALVGDLTSRGDPDRFEVVVLESGRDGVAQISEVLAAHEQDLTAVHLVSHGDGEGLQLGDTWLSGASLGAHADGLAGWGSAFAEGADLLLYGCNLASSEAGRALVADLSGLTGTDVAASDDLTGAAALGGDWDLEYATGAIEAGLPFGAGAREALQTVLAPPDAADDVAVTTSGTPVVIDVISGDTDPDGDGLRVLDFSRPANGTIIDNGDGTLTYTPNAGFTGDDSFEYVATDDKRGLTHYWKLDGDATDSEGSNHGTVFGATEVGGVYGTALAFDETNDRVEIPDFSYANDFSVAFRFKVDDLAGAAVQYLYSHGPADSPDSLSVYLGETGSAVAGMMVTNIRDVDDGPGAGDLNVDVSSLVGDGQWHTYTLVVRSGVGSEVYIDGGLGGASTRGGDSINPGQALVLGAREDLDPAAFYGGSIDGVMVFDRALIPGAVGAIHSGGPALAKVTVTVTNAAPVAKDDAYTLDEDTTLGTDAWKFRRQLTFDQFAHTEDLADFPVLVTLNPSRIQYGQTQPNGEDLRLYDSDGTTRLAHEIEQWNPGGTSYVWVRVPLIEGSNPADSIWMEYGNPHAADGQDPDGVWESGYRLV
ncbi:MAG: DUF2341 domain-containing protein, partial [Deltaproteobacteria bacterium]|nr:DUF2341 domain-containing protein [Deltaproteobacteria bacterium]